MSLLLKNIFFTFLQPGTVCILIPYLILGQDVIYSAGAGFFESIYVLLLFFIGLTLYIHCIFLFIHKGKGTLSPAMPTKKLVDTGMYKYSRNPMYLSVMIILIAECFLFKNKIMVLYSAGIFVLFNFFIIMFEEPRLKKAFGHDYLIYANKVNRWI